MSIDPATKQALRQTADTFRQFSRNGRWGSCGFCPRDMHGHSYPEFCKEGHRVTHWMTAKDLAENFEKHRSAR